MDFCLDFRENVNKSMQSGMTLLQIEILEKEECYSDCALANPISININVLTSAVHCIGQI